MAEIDSPQLLTPAVIQSLGGSSNEIHEKAFSLLHSSGVNEGILDYGSGQARALKSLHRRGLKRLSGVDMMPRPKDLPSEIDWITSDLNLPISAKDESFNAIMALEVIEHLENPRSMLRDCFRLLRTSGTLVLSTPNNSSIRSIASLLLRGHYVSFLEKDYPAHITALLKMDLSRILTETGFKDIRFDYSPKGLIPGARGLSWQKVSAGLLSGERFSDNIFIVARKP